MRYKYVCGARKYYYWHVALIYFLLFLRSDLFLCFVCVGSHCTALLSPHRKISVKFPDHHSSLRALELEGQATDKLGLDMFYQVNCCSLTSIMQIRIRV